MKIEVNIDEAWRSPLGFRHVVIMLNVEWGIWNGGEGGNLHCILIFANFAFLRGRSASSLFCYATKLTLLSQAANSL